LPDAHHNATSLEDEPVIQRLGLED
jgi:hypothetical protein